MIETYQSPPRAMPHQKVVNSSVHPKFPIRNKSNHVRRDRPRCKVEGCKKFAQSRGHCKRHGGGTYCMILDCQRYAQVDRLCSHHGGKRLCEIPGCTKLQQSRRRCVSHGGGRPREKNEPLLSEDALLSTHNASDMSQTKNLRTCVRHDASTLDHPIQLAIQPVTFQTAPLRSPNMTFYVKSSVNLIQLQRKYFTFPHQSPPRSPVRIVQTAPLFQMRSSPVKPVGPLAYRLPPLSKITSCGLFGRRILPNSTIRSLPY